MYLKNLVESPDERNGLTDSGKMEVLEHTFRILPPHVLLLSFSLKFTSSFTSTPHGSVASYGNCDYVKRRKPSEFRGNSLGIWPKLSDFAQNVLEFPRNPLEFARVANLGENSSLSLFGKIWEVCCKTVQASIVSLLIREIVKARVLSREKDWEVDLH